MASAVPPSDTLMVSRAVRLCIDLPSLTERQRQLLTRHGGGNRQIFNWALARLNAHADWKWQAALSASCGQPDHARKLLQDKRWVKAALAAAPPKIRDISKAALCRAFTVEKADPDSPLHWWVDGGVNRFAMSSALDNLMAATDRYYKDIGGCRTRPRRKARRDNRPHGWPHFKRKAEAGDSFALFNLTAEPVTGAHRITVPTLGSLRVHNHTKRLRRLLNRGGLAKSARFTQAGRRWYVTIVVAVPAAAVNPRPTTRAQKTAGTVGVDLGVIDLAVLSTGEKIPNPRHWRRTAAHIARLQRRVQRLRRPRGQKQTARYRRAVRQLAHAQHLLALRRHSGLHAITKRLATEYATIGIEDLNVTGMLTHAHPVEDPNRPGHHLPNGAAAKTGLSRSLSDAAFGEIRRQLTYKTHWYASELVVIDRYAATSKTCSHCATAKATLSLSEREFHCAACGLTIGRDHNAAINIAALAMRRSSPSDEARRKTPSGASLKEVLTGTHSRTDTDARNGISSTNVQVAKSAPRTREDDPTTKTPNTRLRRRALRTREDDPEPAAQILGVVV